MKAMECMKRALLYRGLSEETHRAKPRNSAGFTEAARWGLAEPRATTAARELSTVSFTSYRLTRHRHSPCSHSGQAEKLAGTGQ